MSRVRSFFLEEAQQCLSALSRELDRDAPDPQTLYRAARVLRGSAQLARFRKVREEGGDLEGRLRVWVRSGGGWDETMRPVYRSAVERLNQLVADVQSGAVEPEEEKPMETESVGGAGEAGGDEPFVPIEELEYAGPAALERALELRVALEDAIVSDDPAGPVMDELFDLIRLGMK